MSPDKIGNKIAAKFGNRLRTRVNGVLIQEEKILMINHQMGDQSDFWSVPGGGMKFGSNAKQNLKREFQEEIGLEIQIGKLLFVHEFLESPLHAIELFFEVERSVGEPHLGWDPEFTKNEQILRELKWMSLEELRSLPNASVHQIFWGINSFEDLGMWKGYFNFENKYLK
ncbi:NUDIX domain-containing protein [Algoriphagus sp.]|uniref:NUDIX domain-containing protein n=1 Tax=Algoriphagus sp. TaxID=1872435 RepID=UPI002607F177|nr:NUDIX domain-containing protein [Algoriphagus sp.]